MFKVSARSGFRFNREPISPISPFSPFSPIAVQNLVQHPARNLLSPSAHTPITQDNTISHSREGIMRLKKTSAEPLENIREAEDATPRVT